MEISFFLFLIINQIHLFKCENVYNFKEKTFFLTKSEFFKTYKFIPKTIENLEHEIILQIREKNDFSNGKLNICTGFFHNINEENIYFDYSRNEFINCQKNFSVYITDYIELNIEKSFYSSNTINNGYYYIVIYIDRQIGNDFSGVIMPFVTNTEIRVSQDEISRYFYFKNDYNINNYSFVVPNDRLQQKNLHIQIELIKNENFFDLIVFNDNNHILDIKNSINSYNYFIDFNNSQTNYFVNISFLKDNKEIQNNDFAIHFEYTSFNNDIMKLSNDMYEITFLTKIDYYFAISLSDKNNYLNFILNDFFGKKGNITLSSSKINLADLSIDKIQTNNFAICKKRNFMDNLFIFNYKNENLSDTSNILVLKLSGSGASPLKLHKIQFKILPKIIIEDENDFVHYSFNSESIIERFGYFYIPKTNNETKRQLIYCSEQKTMSILRGDYNIIEEKFLINLISDDLRLYKVPYQQEFDRKEYYNGITIITFNNDKSYFVQIMDVSEEVYNNLVIEKFSDKNNLNKEIELNYPIKNHYIFCINDYSSEISDLILDKQIIYGNLSVEYIDIDAINEKDFKFNKILLFKNDDYSIINARHPILIKKTTELLKITNYNYNEKYLFKAKLYLNKYFKVTENKIYNSLMPIYLNGFESKKYILDKNFENINYIFKLGDNYFDYVNNSNITLVQIILGNNNINNIFNISNGKNIIKGNNTYTYFSNKVGFINYLNKPILIWCFFGKQEYEQENSIISVYLSKNYYYLYRFSVAHKFIFDWYNIRNKMESGLIPQKIEISILNERNTKATGCFYQKLTFSDENNNDYLYYYSNINSITYELDEGKSHIFLSEEINITEYDYHYNGESFVNFIVFPESGLITALFYIEYLYDISEYENELKFFQFDNSIYSLNLKPNNTFTKNMNINSSNKSTYLYFQFLSCGLRDFQKELNISFKYKVNNGLNDDNNSIIKIISPHNVIGYVDLEEFDIKDSKDNLYINILKPNRFYIKYTFLSNFDEEFYFQNDYNITIEREINSKGHSFFVTFDRFLNKTKTNYTILVVDKDELKKIILTECDFFSFLENQNNYKNYKYINFIDNNLEDKIKKEIYFGQDGNYEILIMAQSLESLFIYKYLGSVTYTYNYRIRDRHIDDENESKDDSIDISLLIVIILSILFILLLILFIFFYFKKKKILMNLLNSKNENLLASKINYNENVFINEYELETIINDSSIDIIDKFSKKENKPKHSEEKFNIDIGNNIDIDIENNLSEQPPAPLSGNTFYSEEDRMKFELKKLKYSQNIKENQNDEDKKYFNTNIGEE